MVDAGCCLDAKLTLHPLVSVTACDRAPDVESIWVIFSKFLKFSSFPYLAFLFFSPYFSLPHLSYFFKEVPECQPRHRENKNE